MLLLDSSLDAAVYHGPVDVVLFNTFYLCPLCKKSKSFVLNFGSTTILLHHIRIPCQGGSLHLSNLILAITPLVLEGGLGFSLAEGQAPFQ